MVVYRHITYMSLSLVTNVYYFMSTFAIFDKFYDNMEDGQYKNNMTVKTFKILFISSGIFMPTLRILEPFFFKIMWEKAKRFFCCRQVEENEKTLIIKPIFMGFASSFNVELVYVILKGVT